MAEERRIGLPRSLLYHKFHALWTTFFEELGWRTVTSPPTNRLLLERGVALAVDESCVPMKVLLGHVESLRGRCDAVLVPRIGSLIKSEHVCVKFMGAYDIVRNTLPDLPLVTYDVDADRGVHQRASMLKLARELGAGPFKARRAYAKATAAQRAHDVEMVRLQESALEVRDPEAVRILVVGHSYSLADELIGKPVLDYLGSLGVEVLTSDAVDKPKARELSRRISPTIKWTYNKELLGAIELYREHVDGIVFVVTFPCGPDSLMAELCQRRITGVPIVTLVLDELQGEAGLRTRLESFVDIIRAKRTIAERARAHA